LEFDVTTANYAWPKSSYWKPTLVDKTAPAVFVLLTGYEPDDNLLNATNDSFKSILLAARQVGFLSADEKIIGIKMKDGKPAIGLGTKWEPLSGFLRTKIEEAFKKNAALPQQLADYIQTTNYEPFIKPKAAGRLVQGCLARNLLEEYTRMQDGKKYMGMHTLFKTCPKLFSTALPKPTTYLNDEEKAIWTHYPMLKWAEYALRHADCSATNLQKAVDYINMVELMNISAGRTSKTAV
jgi:hypothetical protein